MKMEPAGRVEEADAKDPITGEVTDMKNTKLIKFVNLKNKCSRPELKATTHFDFTTDTQKGGWNIGRDLLEILRKRGRISQSGATFKYMGLNIPEFTERGKANGESKFLHTPELLNDGFALLDKLRQEDVGKTLLVDQAVIGVDIQEFERGDQKVRMPSTLEGEKNIPTPLVPSATGDVTL